MLTHRLQSTNASLFFAVGFVTLLGHAGLTHAQPAGWSCNAAFYDAHDGCDCACGAPDPDCSEPGAPVYNCPTEAIGCNVDGACRVVPDAWSCNDAFYDDNGGCDCSCGALDPDCARDDQVLYGCASGAAGCNVDGECRVVPPSWTCAKTYFDARDGCDCGCGAYDPDCAVAGQTLHGCPAGATGCKTDGTCIAIPQGWSCLASHYGTGDGCDCACGAADPDCALPDQTLYGCPPGATSCSATGQCESIPSSWTCPDSWYGAGDGCDCSCGAQDADCALPGASLYGCPQGATACSGGTCVVPSGPPPGWFCAASHYDADDGCDCGCGAPDPDCQTPGAALFGCPSGSPGCSGSGTCLQPPVGPPPSWSCGAVFYDREDGCDCGCGAYDPDCSTVGAALYGCPQNATGCAADGACVLPTPAIPVSWTCGAGTFGTDDGCHCDCGAPDPDCATATAPIVGCGANATGCSTEGECVIPSCTPQCAGKVCGGDGCGGVCGTCDAGKNCASGQCVSNVPPIAWSCSASFYGAVDGCDCGCGALDPDCAEPGATLFGCAQGDASCDAAGKCVKTGDPTLLWTCAESYYDALDGCDCGCGVIDPDCAAAGATLYGCPQEATGCSPGGTCIGVGEPPPPAWTCPASRYGGLDGCDCGCGVRDPDCDVGGADLYGCPQDATGCSLAGTCIIDGCTPSCTGRACGPDSCGGTCGQCGGDAVCNTAGQCVSDGVPASWTCNPGLYDNNIACNCDCGASDPDCANVTLPVEGCEVGALGCDAVGSCVYPEVCVPQCDGRECGGDRCEGSCGTCSSADFCSAEGECLPRVVGGDGDDDDDGDTVVSGCSACANEGSPLAFAFVFAAVAVAFRRRSRASRPSS
jgi:hypothetical protein